MHLVTIFKRSFILFLLTSRLMAFDYHLGDSVLRTVTKEKDEIQAEITVVNTDPLKLKIVLYELVSTKLLGKLDTRKNPKEYGLSEERWNAQALLRAKKSPLYLTIEGDQFTLANEDLQQFWKWKKLQAAIEGGLLFDILFSWQFVLNGKELQEGLLFEQDGQVICVEKLSDDYVVASIDGKGEFTLNQHHPLEFFATYDNFKISSTPIPK